MIKFAAIDMSMRNCGLAFGTYDVGQATYNVGEIHLIQTFASKEKKVRKSALDYQACREMYIKMHGFINAYGPQVVFAEMPIGSQSANGMKSYGISIALLGTIGVPVIQVTPNEVKVAAVASRTASKETMIAWAYRLFPDVQWLTRKIHGEVKLVNKNEHMADAIGAAEAGIATDQFQQLLAMSQTINPATPIAESGL